MRTGTQNVLQEKVIGSLQSLSQTKQVPATSSSWTLAVVDGTGGDILSEENS